MGHQMMEVVFSATQLYESGLGSKNEITQHGDGLGTFTKEGLGLFFMGLMTTHFIHVIAMTLDQGQDPGLFPRFL